MVPNKEARLGTIQKHKLQVLVWWAKDCHCRTLAIIEATWNAASLKGSNPQINIEAPTGGYIKVAHPYKVETWHKWTTWDVKWENSIGYKLGVLVIPLDYVLRCDRPVG